MGLGGLLRSHLWVYFICKEKMSKFKIVKERGGLGNNGVRYAVFDNSLKKRVIATNTKEEIKILKRFCEIDEERKILGEKLIWLGGYLNKIDKCCVCSRNADFRIGRYSKLVCNKHAEEYKKDNKKVREIVDKF